MRIIRVYGGDQIRDNSGLGEGRGSGDGEKRTAFTHVIVIRDRI